MGVIAVVYELNMQEGMVKLKGFLQIPIHTFSHNSVSSFKSITTFFFSFLSRREETRKSRGKPQTTLFVANFDPSDTSSRDLEKLFSPYGDIVRACFILIS